MRAEAQFGPDLVTLRVRLFPLGETLAEWRFRTSDIMALPSGGFLSMAGDILKRLGKVAGSRTASIGVIDANTRKKYPAIVELMSDDKDADGADRDLSSITIKWQEGTWRAGIHEPGLEMTLWVSASSLDTLLQALEERLRADDADWRAWNQQSKKRSFKPRK